jgi:hypothetical protein
MLYREIIAVCSQIHTKHINTPCGQNVVFVDVKPGGTYSDHLGLKSFSFSLSHKYHYYCFVVLFVCVCVTRAVINFGSVL